jgi:hypothetical protein
LNFQINKIFIFIQKKFSDFFINSYQLLSRKKSITDLNVSANCHALNEKEFLSHNFSIVEKIIEQFIRFI